MSRYVLVALLGLLILVAMGGAGYALIRPRVCRPALHVGAHLSSDSDLETAVECGARLALSERDGRGGPYRVSYAPWTSPCCAKDYDNSNSSYAPLGLREPSIHLPGLDHSRRLKDSAGNPLASLSPHPRRPAIPSAIPLAVSSSSIRVKPKSIVLKRRPPLQSSDAEGRLLIFARLKPPPAEFVRRSGSADPFAWAAYRSCLRLLDALDRSIECRYDPFSDPEVATLGVYRLRAGRFELVGTLR